MATAVSRVRAVQLLTSSIETTAMAGSSKQRRHLKRLKAYEDGLTYGTVEFKQTVYGSHRRIVDKTKW
jgi:hypothetical protein